MFELLLLFVSLFSLVFCPILLFYGLWGWAIVALLLFVASFAGIVRSSTMIQGALKLLLGYIFSPTMRAQITSTYTGVPIVKPKITKKTKPSGFLTKGAKQFLANLCWAPVGFVLEIWGFLISIPGRIYQLLVRVSAWRPKFKLPRSKQPKFTPNESNILDDIEAMLLKKFNVNLTERTSRGFLEGIESALADVERSEPVAAMQVQEPTANDFKVRTVMRMLLEHFGVAFGANIPTDSLLDLAVSAIEKVLPELKTRAQSVDGLNEKNAGLQTTVTELRLELESAKTTMSQTTEAHAITLQAKEDEIVGLLAQLKKISRQLSEVSGKLEAALTELKANDEQNDQLLQKIEVLRELRTELIGDLALTRLAAHHAASHAEAEIRRLKAELDLHLGLTTPLLIFGHPVGINCIVATDRLLSFHLVVSGVPEESEQIVAFLRAHPVPESDDITKLFEVL